MDECKPLAGGLELATLLVEKGAVVNAFVVTEGTVNTTPLWLAARAVAQGVAGAAELATLLVEMRAKVNAVGTDEDGFSSTPLWWAARAVQRGTPGRGLHSSTFRLNISAYWGIGGAFEGCLGGVRSVRGVFKVYFVSESSQAQLKSGRV